MWASATTVETLESLSSRKSSICGHCNCRDASFWHAVFLARRPMFFSISFAGRHGACPKSRFPSCRHYRSREKVLWRSQNWRSPEICTNFKFQAIFIPVRKGARKKISVENIIFIYVFQNFEKDILYLSNHGLNKIKICFE